MSKKKLDKKEKIGQENDENRRFNFMKQESFWGIADTEWNFFLNSANLGSV